MLREQRAADRIKESPSGPHLTGKEELADPPLDRWTRSLVRLEGIGHHG